MQEPIFLVVAIQKGFFLTRDILHSSKVLPILATKSNTQPRCARVVHGVVPFSSRSYYTRRPNSTTMARSPDSHRKNLHERTKHTTDAAGRSRPSLDSFSRCVSRRSWPCVTTTRHNLRRARSFQWRWRKPRPSPLRLFVATAEPGSQVRSSSMTVDDGHWWRKKKKMRFLPLAGWLLSARSRPHRFWSFV